MNFVPEVVDASLPKVGEHIGAWLSITFSHQVTVDTDIEMLLFFKLVLTYFKLVNLLQILEKP